MGRSAVGATLALLFIFFLDTMLDCEFNWVPELLGEGMNQIVAKYNQDSNYRSVMAIFNIVCRELKEAPCSSDGSR